MNWQKEKCCLPYEGKRQKPEVRVDCRCKTVIITALIFYRVAADNSLASRRSAPFNRARPHNLVPIIWTTEFVAAELFLAAIDAELAKPGEREFEIPRCAALGASVAILHSNLAPSRLVPRRPHWLVTD